MTWAEARNILCVRLDSLGDVLMTTPALRALKEGGAPRRLTLLTSPAGAAVASLLPELEAAIVYEAPWLKATPQRADPNGDQAMIGRLAAGRFDAAVIFTVFSQNPLPSALLCYLAGIPLRAAYCRENPYQLLTDWLPEPDSVAGGMRHEVRRQLDLVQALGFETQDERLGLRVTEAGQARAVAQAQAAGLDFEQPWVLIHPGASAPSRRYPPESFAAVGAQLAQELGLQVILTGSEGERGLVDDIRGRMSAAGAASLPLVGVLTLEGMAALVGCAPLVISNNTGPAHLAAAMGTPVVDLYALTNPQHTPWQVRQRVLFQDVPCKNCFKSVCPLGHHACLRGVPPEAVVQAARELLEGA